MVWVDTGTVPDVYADGIAGVENLGGCFRAVYFVWQRGPSGLLERVAVAKIVRQRQTLIRGIVSDMLAQEPTLVPRDDLRAH